MNRGRFLARSVGLGGAIATSTMAARSAWAAGGIAAPRNSADVPSLTAAKGPLRVLESNPRYFTDGSGKAIYLAGSHTWWKFEDNGHRLLSVDNQNPPPIFDYNGYRDFRSPIITISSVCGDGKLRNGKRINPTEAPNIPSPTPECAAAPAFRPDAYAHCCRKRPWYLGLHYAF